MKLSRKILDAVANAGVEVEYADKKQVWFMNRYRLSKEEPFAFCGFYWSQRRSNELHGPFKTRMAAINNAYVQLDLQPKIQRKKPVLRIVKRAA